MGLQNRIYTLFRQCKVPYLVLTGRTVVIGVVTLYVLMYDGAGMILLATGLTKPTDASAGFAKGALFIDTDVVSGTSGLYVNQGVTTACEFKLVTNAA
jgi:hypothetical protein